MTTYLELAKFSAAAYGDPIPDPTKWVKLEAAPKNNDGFYAQAYQNIETKEIVITNQGTVPTNVKHLLSDIMLTLKIQHAAQQDAAEYARFIAQKYPDSRITLTGHSLGGNLAQAAAVALKKDGVQDFSTVVFNAPGIGGYELFGTAADYDCVQINAVGDVINKAGGIHLGTSKSIIPAGQGIPRSTITTGSYSYPAGPESLHD